MGIYNEQDAISYLLSYGNWEAQQGDVGTQFTFMDQYDGCIAHWNGRKVSAIDISNIPTDARLYIGFTDGNWDWIKLVPYPLVPNSGAEFTLGDSYIVTPVHHDMFQADTKQILGFSTWGPYFPTGSNVAISYRMRGSATGPPSTSTGDFISSGNQFTFNGERHDLTTPATGIALEVKADLGNNATTMTPILEGIGIHERLVPAFKRDFSFTVDARDWTARRDGASSRVSGRVVRDLVMQAAAAPSTIALEFPEETILNVAMFDYSERMLDHKTVGGQGWAVDCQVTQFGVLTVYGIIARVRGNTIGSLRGFQISSLRYF